MTKKIEKKETEKKEAKKTQKFSAPKIILKKLRITEKTALLTDKDVRVFNVTPNATKNEIKKEVEKLYKVKPLKVNIAKTAAKRVFVRGKKGIKAGVKKAYVYLTKKDAEKIKVM